MLLESMQKRIEPITALAAKETFAQPGQEKLKMMKRSSPRKD
jgi:hypothetical protein